MQTFSLNANVYNVAASHLDLSTDLTRQWAGEYYLNCLVKQAGAERNNNQRGYSALAQMYSNKTQLAHETPIIDDDMDDDASTCSKGVRANSLISEMAKDMFEQADMMLDAESELKNFDLLCTKLAKLESLNLCACLRSALDRNITAIKLLRQLMDKYDFGDMLQTLLQSQSLDSYLTAKGY